MTFNCEICCVSMKCKRNYDLHMKSSRHLSRFNNETSNSLHTCTCGKAFTHLSNLCRHRKKCDIYNNPPQATNNNQEETNTSNVEEMIEQIVEKKMKEKEEIIQQKNVEIEELKLQNQKQSEQTQRQFEEFTKQISILTETIKDSNKKKYQCVQTINHYHGNVSINFNSFNDAQHIDEMKNKTVLKYIAHYPTEFPSKMVEHVYFNPKIPANNLLWASSVNSQTIHSCNKGIWRDWVVQKLLRCILDKCNSKAIDVMEDETFSSQLHPVIRRKFQEFSDRITYANIDNNIGLFDIIKDLFIACINGTRDIEEYCTKQLQIEN